MNPTKAVETARCALSPKRTQAPAAVREIRFPATLPVLSAALPENRGVATTAPNLYSKPDPAFMVALACGVGDGLFFCSFCITAMPI